MILGGPQRKKSEQKDPTSKDRADTLDTTEKGHASFFLAWRDCPPTVEIARNLFSTKTLKKIRFHENVTSTGYRVVL